MRNRAMVLLLSGLMVLCALPARGREFATEDAVKAAILYNLGNFVNWQTGDESGPNNAIVLGVIGEDSLQKRLASMAGVKGNGSRVPISILAIKNVRELKNQRDRLHMLYISSSARKMTPGILELVAGRPVLTISDDEEFVDSGGIMNFVRENSRIRFDVNLDAADDSGLKISARLFGLARRIIKKNTGEKSP